MEVGWQTPVRARAIVIPLVYLTHTDRQTDHEPAVRQSKRQTGLLTGNAAVVVEGVVGGVN